MFDAYNFPFVRNEKGLITRGWYPGITGLHDYHLHHNTCILKYRVRVYIYPDNLAKARTNRGGGARRK